MPWMKIGRAVVQLHSLTSALVEIWKLNCVPQLFYSQGRTLVPNEQEAEWVSKPAAWTSLKRKNSLAPIGIRTLNHPTHIPLSHCADYTIPAPPHFVYFNYFIPCLVQSPWWSWQWHECSPARPCPRSLTLCLADNLVLQCSTLCVHPATLPPLAVNE